MLFRRAALALLAALLILALPAVASAAVTVNSTADEPDASEGLPCQTAAGKCTLRAAIEVTNSIGSTNIIDFDGTVFQGQLVDTIALASPLPPIEAQLNVIGKTCATEAGVSGPCVGVSAPSGSFGITVDKEGVTISGLSVTGALIGISVINGAAGFTAHGNWVGVKLDGSAGANNTGIFIDPESDAATIGGTEEAQRNVIAGNNLEGLDIEGASDAVVRGNYFGVAPDGTTQMANGKNIEITDSTAGSGFPAEDNEVGATIEGPALASEACDGGCNVISGALSSGVDLVGEEGGNEEPASGPTTVHGNFVGLKKDGTGTIANGSFGILVGAADHATIGGPNYEANANFIAGGTIGIFHSNGEDFVAMSNQIGIGPVKAETTSPAAQIGIFAYGSSVVEPATIEENAIRGGGIAIEARFGGSTIAENLIGLSFVGIRTEGSGATGSLIADNMIGSTIGDGILIQSDANEVQGNLVLSSGGAGISVRDTGEPFASPTTENVIGGDFFSEENEISDSGGPAIEIVNFEETANEVARNSGKLNGGLFIDLKATNPGTEPNGPNGGIKPPPIGTLTESSASGSGAEEGAVIRVFRKGSAEAGELESFLAETTADAGGDWKVDYPAAIPGGTIIAATQTSKGATSELAIGTTPGGPSGGGDDGGQACPASTGCDSPKPPKRDVTPPETKILKAPLKKTKKTTAKFKFSSSEAGSTFECKLDRKPFKKCASPKKYKKLKPGKHVFKVRAIDKAGNVDPTPAKRKFTVLRS
ncbi:MAG TPA: right-handed parallel beta-helix repeat-containing protein [Solirubrobacterales bacterium]|nr:right-handed parallel beta-helix repeat-containing protein [Solirubrobacterales bacterium]